MDLFQEWQLFCDFCLILSDMSSLKVLVWAAVPVSEERFLQIVTDAWSSSLWYLSTLTKKPQTQGWQWCTKESFLSPAL